MASRCSTWTLSSANSSFSRLLIVVLLRPSVVLAVAQDYPDFRQAESLKADVDDRVVKDGLLGLGVAGAVAALALGVILGAGRRK